MVSTIKTEAGKITFEFINVTSNQLSILHLHTFGYQGCYVKSGKPSNYFLMICFLFFHCFKKTRKSSRQGSVNLFLNLSELSRASRTDIGRNCHYFDLTKFFLRSHKTVSRLVRRRFSQTTNERIWFFCCEEYQSQKTKYVRFVPKIFPKNYNNKNNFCKLLRWKIIWNIFVNVKYSKMT